MLVALVTLARNQMTLTRELLEFFPPLDPGEFDDVVALAVFRQLTGHINQILVGQISDKEVNCVDDISALWRTLAGDRLEGLNILGFGQGFPDPAGSTVQSEDPMPGKVDHNHLITDLAPRYPLTSLNLHPHLQHLIPPLRARFIVR